MAKLYVYTGDSECLIVGEVTMSRGVPIRIPVKHELRVAARWDVEEVDVEVDTTRGKK